jgi:hypothetical protein
MPVELDIEELEEDEEDEDEWNQRKPILLFLAR